MHKLLKLNLILIVIYLLALSLAKVFTFPYLAYFFGLVIFFLPGLNLALALEQLTGWLGRANVSLWTFLFSLIITPAFIFYVPLEAARVAQEREVLLTFFLWNFLALAFFLSAYLFKKNDITTLKIPSFKKYGPFWLAVLLFILLLGIHYAIYPFIPEIDGYSYIQSIEKSIDLGKFCGTDNRYIFYSLAWTLHHLTQIPLYWLFKLVFPFLGLGMIVVSYKTSSDLGVDRKYIIPASLSFVLFPSILQAILTFRPQTVFLFVLPMMMWLVLDALRKKNLLATAALLSLAVVGIGIHQAFVFLVVGITPVFFYLIVKKYRLKSAFVLGILLLAIPIFLQGQIIGFWHYFLHLSRNAVHLDFRWWFLDNYTTNYGEKVSWPGLSSIYYYGNNLGMVFPILLVAVLWKKTRMAGLFRNFWPLILLLAALVSFAEILPRIGIIYEPNRFWLFSAAILALIIPHLVRNLQEKMDQKILLGALVVLMLTTLGASFALTYSKRGMIEWSEYQAVGFIQKNTPENAIFLTAKSSSVLFDFFYHRKIVVPPKHFFLEDQKENDRSMLQNLENEHRPIYVFYSKDKEKGIRKGRDWWEKINFFGADLAKFDDPSMYEKVFENEGVVVWKVL